MAVLCRTGWAQCPRRVRQFTLDISSTKEDGGDVAGLS